MRNDSDYEDFYIVSKPAAVGQLDDAKAFLNAVEGYINNLPGLKTDGTEVEPERP